MLYPFFLITMRLIFYFCGVFRRDTWALHSTCGLWQQLVDQTKEEAKQKLALADLYAARLTVLIAQRADDLQRISRKVRFFLCQNYLCKCAKNVYCYMQDCKYATKYLFSNSYSDARY